MGLLSDPQNQQKILARVLIHHRAIIWLLVFGSVLGWLALALPAVSQGDHVQENALMAGARLDTSFTAKLHDDVKAIANQLKTQNSSADVIAQYWTASGLNVQQQSYETQDGVFNNLFTVLPSQRGNGAESLVLHASHRGLDGSYADNTAGVALVTVLARHFSTLPWWHKDVIVVVTPDHNGTKAFAEQLISTTLFSDVHINNSVYNLGAPQAAISLQQQDLDHLTHLELALHGYNGLMPNYDMVVAVKYAADPYGVLTIPTTESLAAYYTRGSAWISYQWALACLWTGMQHMASGVPAGDHAPFLSANIPAVTIRMASAKQARKRSTNQVGALMEVIFRYLNNLEQRLNLSFTFYIPVGRGRFVSIGRYLGPVAAMLLAMALQALVLWWQSAGDDVILLEFRVKTKHDKNDANDGNEKPADEPDQSADNDQATTKEDDIPINNTHSTAQDQSEAEAPHAEPDQDETGIDDEQTNPASDDTPLTQCQQAPLPWSPSLRHDLGRAFGQLAKGLLLGGLTMACWPAIASTVRAVVRQPAAMSSILHCQGVAALSLLCLFPWGVIFGSQWSKCHSCIALFYGSCLLVPVMFLNAPLAMMAALVFLLPILIASQLNNSVLTALAVIVSSPVSFLALQLALAQEADVWMDVHQGMTTQQLLVLTLVGIPLHWTIGSKLTQ